MAKILKAIEYSKEAITCISKYKIDKNLDHTIWDTDDLDDLKKEIRDYYRTEQKAICSYCRETVSVIYPMNSHIEHIAPKSLYPEYIFQPENLCIVCSECNLIKKSQETLAQIPDTIKTNYKTKYPNKPDDYFIVHPHFDDYDEHILIINGFYIDKNSKKGNFTIGACRLNRKLSVVGWEPEIVEESKLVEDFEKFIDEKSTIKKGKILEEIKKKLFF